MSDDKPEKDTIREGFEGADDQGDAPAPKPEQNFEGYTNVDYSETQLKPPPAVVKPSGDPPKQEFPSAAVLSEEQCRQALLEEVAQHCCWGKKPAEELTFQTIQSTHALHLTLESFCEARGTSYAFVPYRGEPIDGPQFGRPPGPWEMEAHADSLFHNHKKYFTVPHTEYTAACHRCNGYGQVRCGRCRGWGRLRCFTCSGTGTRTEYRGEQGHVTVRCHNCHGGMRICHSCGGDGRVRCPTCQGCRSLKHYIKLTVSFNNHVSDFILETTDMPDHLIRKGSGTPIYEQQILNVWPITQYPVPQVNQHSSRLISEHNSAFANERRLMQRQKLRSVPVTECHYNFKEENKRFWVYGHNTNVHCPDYPAQCCWGCTIV